MSPYRIVRACIGWSCRKLRLHHPERPFDVPEPVVYVVYLPFLPIQFGRHQYVVSCQLQVVLELLPVSGKSDVGVVILSRQFDGLFLPQGRMERGNPLLGFLGADGLPVAVFVFVVIDSGHALVAVDDLSVSVGDIRPAFVLEYPFQFLLCHHLGRLREDVSVIASASSDVLGAVQALVGNLYDLRPVPFLLTDPLQGARKMGFLALVSREYLHLVGDDVGIEHQCHGYDGIGPVLLGWSPLPESGFAVDLEVIVGAVEIDLAEVPSELPVDCGIEDVDDILDDRTEIGDAGIHLVHRNRLGRILVHQREDLGEGLPLGAGIDDPRFGKRKEYVGKAVVVPASERKEVDLLPDVEIPCHAFEEKVSVVDEFVAVVDLFRSLPASFRFHLRDLFPEPLLALFVRFAVLPQLRKETESHHGSVPVLLLFHGIVAVIDLEVDVSVLPLRLPEKIGHIPVLLIHQYYTKSK